MSSTPSIRDIQVVKTAGPWQSKSGGDLSVIFKLPRQDLENFMDYDNPAFDEVSEDIRGLRMYTVEDIPTGSVGGKEWHKIRTEFITCLGGAAVLECVDLNGDERKFVLDGRNGVIVPPRILHTYEALEDNTSLLVVANTLFIPEKPETHDTYPVESFEK